MEFIRLMLLLGKLMGRRNPDAVKRMGDTSKKNQDG